MLRRTWIAWVVLCLCACEARGGKDALRVFAAASLRDALTELEGVFGEPLVLNLAASNLLAQQIRAGARADVFLSAGALEVDALAAEDLLVPGTRRDLLGNTLVVVQPDPLPEGVPAVAQARDLLAAELGRVALADPEAVPAGRYARAWLEDLGLWQELAPRAIEALDVRAALALVESGVAGAGLVYRTDVFASARAKETFAAEGANAPRVVYPVAVPRQARDVEAARAFLEFLGSPEARTVFERHGFLVLP